LGLLAIGIKYFYGSGPEYLRAFLTGFILFILGLIITGTIGKKFKIRFSF
jgi:hypothetical protein